MFPSAFNAQSDKIMNSLIDDAKRNYNQTINLINNSRKMAPDFSKYVYTGTEVGLVSGFFGCVGVCIFTQQCLDAGEGVTACLLTWGLVTIFSAIIGGVVWKVVKTAYENNESKLDLRSSQETQKYDQNISNIQNQAARDQRNYLKAFEKNAQNMSVKLAESQLAKRVIEWMTDGFCRTIDAADRRKHIEQINVPFRFEVYTNKITCNLGTFDFEIERCRNLSSPLEQTALARAIAAAIQLNITMKYPKDASGTDRTVNFEFTYTDSYPVVILSYIAPNGNYQAVTDW